jgi:ubiquinone/menaquinone biosynthesis C-methylase UbiE
VASEALRCDACGTNYPRLGPLPWLFRDPDAVLGEWRNRLTLYLEELAQDERLARADLADPSLLAAARPRLMRLADAYAGQRERVAELLAPLALGATPAALATQRALGTRVPQHQDLHSYYTNLHRDWAWGGEENARSAELVGRALAARHGHRLLVLGAGACRLAYDLHQNAPLALTVALDINPLLLLVGERVLSGGALELYEFPIAPRSAADQAVLRTLKAPAPAREGLELVFGDALDAPFAAQTFDRVLTPWLIDIVDDDFLELALRVNRLLGPGGRWVNFGSLAFPGRRPRARYAPDEIERLLADAGFRVAETLDAELPYMRSPASRHARVETVYLFSAEKCSRAPRAPARPDTAAWLADCALPVPPLPELEVTALASRLQAFILALVDGRRSIDDIARYVTEQKLLAPDAARAAVRGLLARLLAEGARASRH